MILCLGSGIRSGCGYDAETTIFQDYGSGAKRHGNILTDNRNNGYFLWEEDDLRFFEKDNVSRDMKDQTTPSVTAYSPCSTMEARRRTLPTVT